MIRPLRESDIEKHLVKRVKELGGEVRKVQWIGRSGAPDRLVMLDPWPAAVRLADRFKIPDQDALALVHQILGQCVVWPELKAPGKKAKPHQAREHERMRKMGQRVVVIDSYEQIEELFK